MKDAKRCFAVLLAVLVAGFCAADSSHAAELKIELPLGRTAYQTNERIDLYVVRSSQQALPAGNLLLALTTDDGSKASFTFPVASAPVAGNDARATEHLYLNGWLLRPGHYTVEAVADGATAVVAIDIFSHVRKTTFKTITWGSSARGAEQEVLGEDSLGFNLLFLNGLGDNSIRGGVDWIQNDMQGGGAQMDLRRECDWSDPYVIRGGAARLSRAALQHRRSPNVLGMHFYDELMLTNAEDPVTKERTPHSVPAQLRAYKAAFGEELKPYHKIDPNNPEDVALWSRWARWKLSLLEANHKLCRFAVEYVQPDFISANQTQCWWMYFANGNYFNVARSLPVVCGHCWYDFGPPDYFSPTQFLEIARARELAKPNWFLPTWFTFASTTRLEHYLSFMTNIQGVAIPPDATVHKPSTPNPGGLDQTAAIVETNKFMGRLGTIFNTMPVTRPPVAMLYSLSQNIHTQVQNMKFNGNGDKQYYAMMFLYLAGKMIQNPFFTVLDEDVLDGTLATHHKAVVLGGIDYLDPGVVAGLEAFAANGGLVLISADCSIKIKGAVRLAAQALHPEQAKVFQLLAEKKYGDITNMMKIGDLFKITEPLAADIEGYLSKAGIAPVFECDTRGIAAYRQAQGDIEYLFAANATPDAELGTRNALRAAAVTISVPGDGRPVYDAVLSREMTEFRKQGDRLSAELRFGPGQMRVLARTARPIRGVRALSPTIFQDYTVEEAPIRVRLGAALLDDQGGVLSGSTPLHIRVVDPLGVTRYDVYRATKLGAFQDEFALAANDPAGEWNVVVRELLSGTEDSTSFTYEASPQCGAVAGAASRAVSFGLDREHVYRFFRVHRTVTVVKGTSDYNSAAAQRLADILEPWGVRCEIVDAAQVSKVRELTDEQARTWVGLDYAGTGGIKPGAANPPQHVGYAIENPVILLGSPEDNALINFLDRYGFLPYKPRRDEFPGRGRGMIAWQRGGISREQESITLIAHDAAGMVEAVGSLYEASTGLNPLTPYKLPLSNSIVAAANAPAPPPEASVAWQMEFPDRALAIRPLGANRLVVLTFDGTLAAIEPNGKINWRNELDTGHAWDHRLDVSDDGSVIAVGARKGLMVFNADGRKLFEAARPAPVGVGHPVPVVTFVAVAPDGSRIADGRADARITVSNNKGEQLWSADGWKVDSQFYFQTAVFSPDGKLLVSLTDKQAKLFNAADGSPAGQVENLNCKFQPARVGGNLLMTDGKQAAALFSPAGAKLLGGISLTATVASAQGIGRNCVIGTEDGTVRMLKALDGKLEDQTVWSYSLPRRIVKKIATGPGQNTAIAYWGGTVHVLDTAGALKATRVFQQDVADMAWLGDRLVVGLADGRLIAIGLPQ